MSWVTPPPDVRVTAKVSVKADFIAPELSAVQPHLQIGISRQGWTDHTVKVPTVETDHRPSGLVKARTAEMSVGRVVVRKATVARPTGDVTGPTDRHRLMREAAAKLAARDGFAW